MPIASAMEPFRSRSEEEGESPDMDSEVFYCGCLTCRRKNNLWISRPTWFRHKPHREEQIRNGQIPVPDTSYAVPLRRRNPAVRQSSGDHPDAPPRKRTTVQVMDRRTSMTLATTNPSPPLSAGSATLPESQGSLQVRREFVICLYRLCANLITQLLSHTMTPS